MLSVDSQHLDYDWQSAASSVSAGWYYGVPLVCAVSMWTTTAECLAMLIPSLGLTRGLCRRSSLQEVLEKHSSLFCLQGMEVNLNVDSNATPKFFNAHSVPLSLKEKVETELGKLESMGIISPVQFFHWAAPIVHVLKQNGTVRICGDFKVTVNQACPTDSYPPQVDEVLANLSGGKFFSKLDMPQAYLQLSLDNESREYVTVTFRSFVCSFHFSENHGKLLQGNEEALKVRAIQKAPKPRNVNELRSFFGIINYYSCFLPNLSTKLSPLYHSYRRTQGGYGGRSKQKLLKQQACPAR